MLANLVCYVQSKKSIITGKMVILGSLVGFTITFALFIIMQGSNKEAMVKER